MVKLRLRRVGKKKQPSYRLVATHSASPRDGRFLETLGFYNPLTEPATISFNEEKVLEWLKKGAQPTDPVQKLLYRAGIWEKFKAAEPPALTILKAKIEKSKAAKAEESAQAPKEEAPQAEKPAESGS